MKHSRIIVVYQKDDKGADTTVPTGEKRLVCFDPVLNEEMYTDYMMDVEIQKANWNQYERFYEGYYQTAIGNVEEMLSSPTVVLTREWLLLRLKGI